MTLRRIIVDGDHVDDVAKALADGAADLLSCAAVAHAHSGLPVGAALTQVLPEGVRLVVGEHLASLAPLLGPAHGAVPEGAAPSHAPGDVDVASGVDAAYAPVLARCEAVLVPTEALAREFTHRFGRNGVRLPPVDVVPYLLPSPHRPPARHDQESLPLTRWLLAGGNDAADPVVRALAADALAGADTTLTVTGNAERLRRLAARLGVEDRVGVCPDSEVLDRLTAGPQAPGFDLVLDLDPLAAAEPALPPAFAAGVPAILARVAGSEEVLDEIAVTGGVRLLPPGLPGSAGAIAVLEAVADLRRSALTRPASGAAPIPALPAWRTSLDAGARLLARHYGEPLVPPRGADARPWPRVLLVDLSGSQRGALGRLARWVIGIGGEAVVVTAGGPPPCADVPGAVTVDLRREQRALARPLGGVRRRLPAPARPAFDGVIGAYRWVRPAPSLVRAALAGPLAPGVGPRPGVDAVVATDAAGAELAGRWTGTVEALPLEPDALLRRLLAPRTGPGGMETP
jgi:hypothetical protein